MSMGVRVVRWTTQPYNLLMRSAQLPCSMLSHLRIDKQAALEFFAEMISHCKLANMVVVEMTAFGKRPRKNVSKMSEPTYETAKRP